MGPDIEMDELREIVEAVETRVGPLSPEERLAVHDIVFMGFDGRAITYVYDVFRDLKKTIRVLHCVYSEYNTSEYEAVANWVKIYKGAESVAKYVDNRLSADEIKTVWDWIESGFDVEWIKYASDICIEKTGAFNTSYARKILENWRSWGYTTIEEIRRGEALYKKNKQRHTTLGFKSDDHKKRYRLLLKKMASADTHHASVAYLLAFDENICSREERVAECFDFDEDTIKSDVLTANWVSDTDRRILTLAFNLWRGANVASVSDVFTESETAEFLFEAIRIRLGMVSLSQRDEQKSITPPDAR